MTKPTTRVGQECLTAMQQLRTKQTQRKKRLRSMRKQKRTGSPR